MINASTANSTIPLSALKDLKPRVVAIKPAVKRGGSWQVTIPKDIADILCLEENKLLFIRLECQRQQLILLAPSKDIV